MARTTQEARVRRMAARQGLTLSKSRRRDPRALDYGIWYLTDATSNRLRKGPDQDGYRSLHQVEAYLTSQPTRTAS
jgi:hypothetical protein